MIGDRHTQPVSAIKNENENERCYSTTIRGKNKSNSTPVDHAEQKRLHGYGPSRENEFIEVPSSGAQSFSLSIQKSMLRSRRAAHPLMDGDAKWKRLMWLFSPDFPFTVGEHAARSTRSKFSNVDSREMRMKSRKSGPCARLPIIGSWGAAVGAWQTILLCSPELNSNK